MLPIIKRISKPVRRFGFHESEEEEDTNISSSNSSDTDSETDSSTNGDETQNEEESIPSQWKYVTTVDDHCEPCVFLGESGWQNNINTDSFTKEDYLKIFLPDKLFEMICKCTNDREFINEAECFLEDKELCEWKPVDIETMRKFFGLTMLMGIVHSRICVNIGLLITYCLLPIS